MSYVIARPQWFINDHGTQYTRGYDQTTVIGYGRTLKAAADRAGEWATRSGYRVYDQRTGDDLGELAIHDVRGYGPARGRYHYELQNAPTYRTVSDACFDNEHADCDGTRRDKAYCECECHGWVRS